jgi:hypothetical protein
MRSVHVSGESTDVVNASTTRSWSSRLAASRCSMLVHGREVSRPLTATRTSVADPQ